VETIRVLVRRGEATEACHLVHAVAVQDGAVVAEAGDAGLVTFFRSSAKPFQALPLVRAIPDLETAEIAIASASHRASPEQLAAVRSLLRRAGADEGQLECGPEDGSRLKHNCSGKHAGMLALCRTRDWPFPGYRLPDHPVQRGVLAEIAAATGASPEDIATGVDGCGVVTFALPLERMAFAFSRLEQLDGGKRVASAMRARPELIRDDGAADTMLMRALPGWTAKGGAEALFCAAGPGGLGVAVKVVDGSQRAVKPALAAFFAELGHALDAFAETPLLNSRGERCGEIVAGNSPRPSPRPKG
jgi:L-asparaginase II